MKNKTCSNCKGKMEIGMMKNHGMFWIGKKIYNNSWWTKVIIGGHAVDAYKCLTCKKIDLYSD